MTLLTLLFFGPTRPFGNPTYIVGVLCIALAIPAAAAIDCASPTIDIGFKLVDNRVVVPTFIGERGPYDFILDTGAGSGASASMEVFKAAQLQARGHGVDTGAGEEAQETIEAVAKNVRVGPVVLGDIPINGIDLSKSAEALGFPSLDGIIGDDLFKRYVVMLDFEQAVMRLCVPVDFVPPPGSRPLPFKMYKDTIPVVDASVEGISGRFWIDLGDRYSLSVLGPFWRAHSLEKRVPLPREALTGFGIGGPIRGLVTHMKDLRFADVKVDDFVARLSLQKKGWLADPDVAANIGMGVLKRFFVVIDYPHERFFFFPTASSQPADGYDRAGMWIGNVGRRTMIMEVTPNSPASDAGLRKGDKVIEVDGRPVSYLDVLPLRERLKDPALKSITIRVRRGPSALVKTLMLRDLV